MLVDSYVDAKPGEWSKNLAVLETLEVNHNYVHNWASFLRYRSYSLFCTSAVVQMALFHLLPLQMCRDPLLNVSDSFWSLGVSRCFSREFLLNTKTASSSVYSPNLIMAADVFISQPPRSFGISPH